MRGRGEEDASERGRQFGSKTKKKKQKNAQGGKSSVVTGRDANSSTCQQA